jgi:hypothetical protein
MSQKITTLITVECPDDVKESEVSEELRKLVLSTDGEQHLELMNWTPVPLKWVEPDVETKRQLAAKIVLTHGSEAVLSAKHLLADRRRVEDPSTLGPHVAISVQSTYEKIFVRKIKKGETVEQAMETLDALVNDMGRHNRLRPYCDDEELCSVECFPCEWDEEVQVYDADILNPNQIDEPIDY